jgi:hypothetical protein
MSSGTSLAQIMFVFWGRRYMGFVKAAPYATLLWIAFRSFVQSRLFFFEYAKKSYISLY